MDRVSQLSAQLRSPTSFILPGPEATAKDSPQCVLTEDADHEGEN